MIRTPYHLVALKHNDMHANCHYSQTGEEASEILRTVQMATVGSINKMYGLCLRAVRQSSGLKLLHRRAFRVSVSSDATLFHFPCSTIANAAGAQERSKLKSQLHWQATSDRLKIARHNITQM